MSCRPAPAVGGEVHPRVSSDLSLLPKPCKTLPTLAPTMLLHPMRELSTKSVHYKRTVARVRRTPTPTALQVATITARKPCRHTEATRRALSTLLSAPLAGTRGSDASSKMSSSVQQPSCDEARRCRLLRHRTRMHKFRCHRKHVMCHRTGSGQGWQAHDCGCEGCREEWCHRCA